MSTFIPAEGLHVIRRDQPEHRGKEFRLLRDHFVATETIQILLPVDFEFDGASFPPVVFPIIAFLDPWARYEYPAAVHDLLYRTQKTSREEADLVFRILMKERGVPTPCRMLIYWAVRLFGRSAWNKKSLEVVTDAYQITQKGKEDRWSDKSNLA